MTQIYLFRHGETEWNVSGRWQGHKDVPLNDLGRLQARLLAERLRDEHLPFTALYSSDLSRAFETAQSVGAAIGLQPIPSPGLREIDLGWWSGLTRLEIAARDPENLTRIDNGEDLPRGGAESFQDVYLRASATIEQIAAAHPGETVLVSSHGGTLRMIIEYAQTHRWAERLLSFIRIGNTSLSVIRRDAEGWHVDLLNDMAHLENPVLHARARTINDAQQV